ncbi:MAG: hypothetical protein AAFW89_14845 [Bacteroidota bacterium]
MPANAKFLGKRPTRISNTVAGVFGGFALTMAFQMMIGSFFEDKSYMLITSAFMSFFLWVGCIMLAIVQDKAWKPWAIFILGTSVCSVIIYLNL